MIVSGKEALCHFLRRQYIRAGMPTKMFRREVLEKYPFCETGRHEDIHTVYKYFGTASKVVLWGKDKYRFIRHGENLSFLQVISHNGQNQGLGNIRTLFQNEQNGCRPCILIWLIWLNIVSCHI